MSSELTLYRSLLADIKVRVRRAQQRAALSANAEMILMYWDIGRMIAARQEQEGWGTAVIPRLARDLKNELPEQKGFSERNIGRMIAFYRAYPILPRAVAKLPAWPGPGSQVTEPEDHTILPRLAAKTETSSAPAQILASTELAQLPSAPVPKPSEPGAPPIVQRAVAQISWAHNVILIEKVKDLPTRLWYARQVLEHGWSRDTLSVQIKNRVHERQGGAITNFAATLPAPHASLATGLLKAILDSVCSILEQTHGACVASSRPDRNRNATIRKLRMVRRNSPSPDVSYFHFGNNCSEDPAISKIEIVRPQRSRHVARQVERFPLSVFLRLHPSSFILADELPPLP